MLPEIVTGAPAGPIVGVDVPVVKLEIVGAEVELIMKDEGVVTVPDGAVTVTGPVVAPAGTVTVIDVDVTAEGVADVPLNDTDVSETVPNAVPAIVTVLPIGPPLGDTCRMTSVVSELRTIDVTLPDWS